ncbi:polyketide synthase [Paenibacillus sp. UMB4589-SE434]|uniref:polyketide synthase n=1 Tax=Paenibacillus sp. UMB4589-SE434 TaxID=3046314 RepID=UPI00254A723E|nr:polyketide synthase [Paenibacillus sp. UMB4589-SE434]MDK8181882.1 polyketide synthase [Paenibacillus sp. UMB4589-SE434]
MKQSIVQMKEIEPGIMLLQMEDREYKNMLTPDMTASLQAAFRLIGADARCRAVIWTGYDSYFSSGGTKEGLLSIHAGQAVFTDASVFQLSLECPVPVIAAMQGHAIGGGLSMGLFADFVVLSRESVYTANYMKYGFTPGMGATFIMPYKLGYSLGSEMLLTGSAYRGGELERRGVPFPVVPRGDVLAEALELARNMALKPRASLLTLKHHLTRAIREQLSEVIQQEIEMHEQTIHQAEVKERITQLFGN